MRTERDGKGVGGGGGGAHKEMKRKSWVEIGRDKIRVMERGGEVTVRDRSENR